MRLEEMKSIENDGIKYYHTYDVAKAIDFAMTCMLNAYMSISGNDGYGMEEFESHEPELAKIGSWIEERYLLDSGETDK